MIPVCCQSSISGQSHLEREAQDPGAPLTRARSGAGHPAPTFPFDKALAPPTFWRSIAPLLVVLAAIGLAGCGGRVAELPVAEPASAAPASPLHVLVVNDRSLGQVIQRHWQAQSRRGVRVKQVAAGELASQITSSPVDVVVYPAALLVSWLSGSWWRRFQSVCWT